MKKGTKRALFAAAGCIAAGVVLFGIGAAAGGNGQFEVHHGRLRFPWYGVSNLPGLGFLEDSLEELGDAIEDGAEGGWLDLPFWSSASTWIGEEAEDGEKIFDGDFGDTVIWDGALPCDLEVELGIHALEIVEGEGDTISLEGHNVSRIQCYVKDGALRLRDVGRKKEVFKNGERKLVLTVPEGAAWETAELSAGLGNISADRLEAGEVSLESDLGSIEIGELNAGWLEADTDLGSILVEEFDGKDVCATSDLGSVELSGSVSGNVTASTDMGSILMTLAEEEDDFNYEIKTDMGNITVGDRDYSGLDREKTVENGSDRKMKLESSMGSIEILWKSR